MMVMTINKIAAGRGRRATMVAVLPVTAVGGTLPPADRTRPALPWRTPALIFKFRELLRKPVTKTESPFSAGAGIALACGRINHKLPKNHKIALNHAVIA